MQADAIESRLNGDIPMSRTQIDLVLASDWYQSLKKAQRAAYASGWFNWLEVGSNQHKKIVSTKTRRFAAEAAQILIAKVSA